MNLKKIKSKVLRKLEKIAEKLKELKKEFEIFDFDDFSFADKEYQSEDSVLVVEDSDDDLISEDDDTDEIKDYEVDHVKEFLEEYIGYMLISIIYNPESKHIDAYMRAHRKTEFKILSNISNNKTDVILHFNDFDGNNAGRLHLNLQGNGRFTEKLIEENFTKGMKYRLIFYGGFAIDYSDRADSQFIKYFE